MYFQPQALLSAPGRKTAITAIPTRTRRPHQWIAGRCAMPPFLPRMSVNQRRAKRNARKTRRLPIAKKASCGCETRSASLPSCFPKWKMPRTNRSSASFEFYHHHRSRGSEQSKTGMSCHKTLELLPTPTPRTLLISATSDPAPLRPGGGAEATAMAGRKQDPRTGD
jgi:hypothetical protein